MKRKISCFIPVIIICICMLPMVAYAETVCQHEVECRDTTFCRKCEKDLDASDTYTLVHSYVGCNDKTTCGYCGEKLSSEDEYCEVIHVDEPDLGAKVTKLNEREHKIVCPCGEESYVDMHVVKCGDGEKCYYCKKKVSVYFYAHDSEVFKIDEDYHWKECESCGEKTMPQIEHYITCADKKAGKKACSFCNGEGVNFVGANNGFHVTTDEVKKKSDGTYVHQYRCEDCNKIITDEFNDAPHIVEPVYFDNADGTHGICCKADDYICDFEKHTYGAYKVDRKATLSKDGSRYHSCKICKSKQTRKINKINVVELSATKYIYDGKVKSPSVIIKDSAGKRLLKNTDYTVSVPSGRKTVGKYTYLITFKGKYEGTKKLSFVINPKSTSIIKITAQKGGFTAIWKKQESQTTGYQIQYSTNSHFSSATTKTVKENSTTTATYTELSKGKKYYVRIRTYKTVSGSKYYSDWSSAKTVTTGK